MSVSEAQIQDLERQGFLVVNDVLSLEDLNWYGMLYEDFISGKLDASNHRHDLGSHASALPRDSRGTVLENGPKRSHFLVETRAKRAQLPFALFARLSILLTSLAKKSI